MYFWVTAEEIRVRFYANNCISDLKKKKTCALLFQGMVAFCCGCLKHRCFSHFYPKHHLLKQFLTAYRLQRPTALRYLPGSFLWCSWKIEVRSVVLRREYGISATSPPTPHSPQGMREWRWKETEIRGRNKLSTSLPPENSMCRVSNTVAFEKRIYTHHPTPPPESQRKQGTKWGRIRKDWKCALQPCSLTGRCHCRLWVARGFIFIQAQSQTSWEQISIFSFAEILWEKQSMNSVWSLLFSYAEPQLAQTGNPIRLPKVNKLVKGH